ncbi:MAG: HAD-IIA family hydrolase [Oscillospiraceae bacterium]|jgi:HAD superfamily hydrolase (TIGR01450 family)|nr:HAD-IIA family hydrolase [Oscillospiraceae bacterium]
MARHPLFQHTKYFIFDMDGTFYLGGEMIPGAGDLVRSLKALGFDYCFFSNNSSRSAALCRATLAGMHFPVDEGRVILSSHVAAHFLLHQRPGARVYLLGNEHLEAEMRRAGVPLAEEDPDLILLGFDTTLTYEKIRRAANEIARGKEYFATHPDLNCPTADGFLPDTGSMIALFAASTGRTPQVLGKPERSTVNFLTEHLGCAPEELCFVGDRLETDIAIGTAHGIPTVLVFSGVTTPADYARAALRADLAVPSLRDLAAYLE